MAKEAKISPIFEYCIPEEMIWAKQTSQRDDYCLGTILDNIVKMMKNVHEGILDTARLNDYKSVLDIEDERFLEFCWLYITIMVGVFFKSGIPYIFEEIRKPKYNYEEHYKLNNTVQEKEDDEVISRDIRMREKSGTLKDIYNSNSVEKTAKAIYMNDLRGLLFETKFELQCKKLSDSRFTFTSWVNELLSEVAPEYVTLEWSVWNKMLSYYGVIPEDNCIIITDFNKLKKKLKNIYQREVKIIIR